MTGTMGSTFTDFLHQYAAKHGTDFQTNQALIEEWQAAVAKLFAQIRQWLAELDPERLITIEEGTQRINEPRLGRYSIPRLDLYVLGTWIGIIPKARLTIGTVHPPRESTPERATGRVDITNDVLRFILYRYQTDGESGWVLDDLRTEPKPLDRTAFEKALMSYLQ
jgi:hypothetical protein